MIAHTFDRFIALWLWRLGFLESFESKLLVKLCHPGMVAVDIGANKETCRLRSKCSFPVLIGLIESYFKEQQPGLNWIGST